MRTSPDTEQLIRCTASDCSCECFKPGRRQLRSCDLCGHSWVAHALDKLQVQPPSSCSPVEVALPGLVFDLSSLVLYGAQAIPIRLKILLDRLYSILTPEQVSHILHTLGWSLGDYVRGYMLQHPGGKVLECWWMVTSEEEFLILKQFLRFGETRPIVELMSLQNLDNTNHLPITELNSGPKSCRLDISQFIEWNRGMLGMVRNAGRDSHQVASICQFEKNSPGDHSSTTQHFGNCQRGMSLLFPFDFPNSLFQCLDLDCPIKDHISPAKQMHHLQKHSGIKDGDRRRQEPNNGKPAFKIKPDPDEPNPGQTLWQHNHQLHNSQGFSPQRMTKEETSSSLFPSLNATLLLPSTALNPSPPSASQMSLATSSSSYPLPSFSSSFLCPLSTTSSPSAQYPLSSSSSPSVHRLPSSICSLPSPAGGRKGRVCCGVCGKSFYDKGTLKIHYNAVHLKIKHRCTVAGCTMVFSSLRSRNRHSANPNPRLHTGTSKDAHTYKQAHRHTHVEDDITITRHRCHCGDSHLSHHANLQYVCQHEMWSPSSPRGPLNSPVQDSTHTSGLQHQAPPSPLLSEIGANFSQDETECRLRTNKTPPGPASITLATHISLSESSSPSDYFVIEEKLEEAHGSNPLTNQQPRCESGDTVLKKKPRKSSMPVKIDRQNMEVES
ncbi:zinc finger protein basonuclin-1 [Thalassophryne amazonica]|uniref:zinc finger protein basonuclin-1 n=1 Tax=Thalassophryne amazonica TaxID=390379 RepID=UPI001470A4A9|nr:zinc finger protein basonuclin-1 [Thalassophryne amazonica]